MKMKCLINSPCEIQCCHFAGYQPQRDLKAIEADIKTLESEIVAMLAEVV